MNRRKLLVIDDELFWHRLLKRLFDRDYDVCAAASCAEGVRMAAELRPDCILLDFHLKDGDAVDVCNGLRNGGRELPSPVVVVSSDPEAEIASYAECHAAYFVLKGSQTMTQLPTIVEKLLANDGTISSEEEPGSEPSY